jgi:hypothetical protein
MLRTRVQRTTASTGVALTVTHGLGGTLDFWALVPVSTRGIGLYRPAATLPTNNVIYVADGLATTVTLDVMCIAYQGRLY